MFFDTNYLIMVFLPTLIISGLAQFYLRNVYKKWSNIANGNRYLGAETARRIMQVTNVNNVMLETTPQDLGDHYDPTSHTVRMSPGVAGRDSVASMAIVAHELGHAQQHQDGSPLIAARNFLLPAVQFSPTLSYALIFAGLIFNFAGLAWLGVGVFALSVGFMILTLPVEFDASIRGLKLLRQSGLIQTEQDQKGARQVLTAAAFTYIAAAITSVLTLLYYASLVSRRD
ncbi:MAG: zinc metallopeptidase [Phototrophicaceae bacterium]